MATEGPQVICCCGAATWARIIAWLEIILNSISTILIILALVGVSNLEFDKPDEKNLKPWILIIMIIGLFMALVGTSFGVLLLVGTNKRRPSYLKAWIIFVSIILIWSVISAAVVEESIGVRIGKCVIQILIYGFGIWVVNILKKEIEDDIPPSRNF